MKYETINSTNGAHLASFREHTDAEIEQALEVAHKTYSGWSRQTFAQRAVILRRVAELMRERIEPLAAMIALEMGKLIDHSRGVPLGGVKRSGYGRELSELGIHEFINKKLVRSADRAMPVRGSA